MIAGKMASACVNNIGVSPDNFRDCPATYSAFGWLSPRVSFSRDDSKKSPDLESPAKDAGDFEFRLDDPVTMLPADELFSDGKLVPLQLSSLKPSHSTAAPSEEDAPSPATANSRRKIDGNDTYLFSPKAPRCSSRWRELLGLKKKQEGVKTTSSSGTSASASTKSIRLFLRNSKTSSSTNFDPTLSLPLLKDTECCACESLSIASSRLSLSSTSSSGLDHDDLPRLSLDSEKSTRTSTSNSNPPRVRMRPTSAAGRVGRSPLRRAHQDPGNVTRGVSVDSPRMNSSGKVVFQSLERSSSSPSSFNGGRPRYCHHLGMERSYSANVVRITPVLNVPVCSLRGSGVFGFGQLFSQSQKKEGYHHHHQRQSSNKNRKECS